MSINFSCPHCCKSLVIPDNLGGSTGKCSGCYGSMTFPRQSIPSNEVSCPICGGRMLKVPELAGQSVNCPHCRRGFVFPGAAVVQQNVLPQTSQSIDHVDEIKHVGFWVAAIISLPSLGLPTVMSVLGGRPRMGFEDALTIANVFWLTAPMTLGIAVDSWLVVEFSKPRSPLRRDLNGHTLLFTLALVIVASGLIGTLLAGLPNPLAEPAKAHGGRFNVMGLAVSAFNIYFIAYGPGMFFSSLVVGVFLGWIWAVKLPAILDQQ